MQGLPKTGLGNDSIFLVVDRFSEMYHVIPCKKISDAIHIAYRFLKRLLGCMGYQRL